MIISDPRVVAQFVRERYARLVEVPMPNSLMCFLFEFVLRRMQDLICDPDRDTWNLGTENDDGLQRKFPTAKNTTADFKWFYHQKKRTFFDLVKKSNICRGRIFLLEIGRGYRYFFPFNFSGK